MGSSEVIHATVFSFSLFSLFLIFFQRTDLLNWFWKYFYVSESPFGTGALSVGNVHYNSTFRLCLCGTNAWWWWVHLHWMCRWARTICICNCGLVVCKVGRGLIIVSVVISAVFAYLDVCSLGITSCKQHTAVSVQSSKRRVFLRRQHAAARSALPRCCNAFFTPAAVWQRANLPG